MLWRVILFRLPGPLVSNFRVALVALTAVLWLVIVYAWKIKGKLHPKRNQVNYGRGPMTTYTDKGGDGTLAFKAVCLYSVCSVPIALLVKLGSLTTLEFSLRIGDMHGGELVSIFITGMLILDTLTCKT